MSTDRPTLRRRPARYRRGVAYGALAVAILALLMVVVPKVATFL